MKIPDNYSPVQWFKCCQDIIAANDFDMEVSLLSPFYQAYLACLREEV